MTHSTAFSPAAGQGRLHLDRRGQVAAAVSISGPATPLPEARLLEILPHAREVAAQMPGRLGC